MKNPELQRVVYDQRALQFVRGQLAGIVKQKEMPQCIECGNAIDPITGRGDFCSYECEDGVRPYHPRQ